MAFIPVPDTAQVELIFDTPAGSAENTLWFHYEGAGDMTEFVLSTLAGQIAEWWVTEMQATVTDEINLREVIATDMSTEIGEVGSSPVDAFGLRADNLQPMNVTMAVSFRTPNRGRSFRGRNYVVGLGEGQVTNDIVGTVTVAAWVDGYALIPDYLPVVLGVPQWNWVIASRYTEGAPRTTGIFSSVTAVQVTDDYVDSQRRRLSGRGS